MDEGYTLRQVGTTVIPYTTCQQTAGVGTFTDEKIICDDGTQGAHYCYVMQKFDQFFFSIFCKYLQTLLNEIQGDDGGPMIDYREDEQKSFVIGMS